jgi:hypothetical protein
MSINFNLIKALITVVVVVLAIVAGYFWGQSAGQSTAQNDYKQQLSQKQHDAFYQGCTRAYTALLPSDYNNYQKLTSADLQKHAMNIERCPTLRDTFHFSD